MRPSIETTGICASVSLACEARAQFLDEAFARLALGLDRRAQRLIRLGLEIPEREFLELVLDLAHAEAIGDRRVNVARLLRDAQPALFRQVLQRPHVVQAVGELDQDHADVVDHRQEHLAEALGLPFLTRRELQGAQFGDALDDVGHVLPEQFANFRDRVGRVLDDVVEETGGDRHGVQAEVGQDVGHLQGVDEVGLAGPPGLALVLVGRKHVCPPEQLRIGLWIGRSAPSRRGPRTGSSVVGV